MVLGSALVVVLGLAGAVVGGAFGTMFGAAAASWIGALLFWWQLRTALRESGATRRQEPPAGQGRPAGRHHEVSRG